MAEENLEKEAAGTQILPSYVPPSPGSDATIAHFGNGTLGDIMAAEFSRDPSVQTIPSSPSPSTPPPPSIEENREDTQTNEAMASSREAIGPPINEENDSEISRVSSATDRHGPSPSTAPPPPPPFVDV